MERLLANGFDLDRRGGRDRVDEIGALFLEMVGLRLTSCASGR
jgi:hypothetical protein